MKRRLIICFLLCLTGLLVVAGCSKKSDATTGTNNPVNSSTGSDQNSQRQRPDVFGQVKGVSGSDISIALAQMPQRNQTQNQSGQNQQNQSPNPPAGTSNGQGQRGNWTLQLTGESKTITIPEGTKIYGGGPGVQNQGQSQGQGQGQGPKEITLNEIKAGDIISVYYKAGTTTVDHVSVRTGGQQSN